MISPSTMNLNTGGNRVGPWSRVKMSASLIGRFGSSAFRLSSHSSVDVACGLVLLFGLGAKALPVWDSRIGQQPPLAKRRGEPSSTFHDLAEQPMSALGHVWTAPWQELSDVAAALVGCGHVSGLFVRRIWPLALMLCADRVPIESTHFKVRWPKR